ncbi:MAG: RNA 3'-terminal phosphate cyclase [Rhizobacter sp.]
MIEIDASQGEGGGQVLRTSLALSMVTGHAVTLTHIRAKRAKPGLMRQHLACVQAATRICAAQTQGAELGSSTISFAPGAVQPGHYRFDVGSAGSCLLVLQTVLPPLLLAAQPSHLTLVGGTHNPMAPPFHFIERAFVPLLRRMGADVQLSLRRHGFYPAGGGEIEAVVYPATQGLKPLVLTDRSALIEGYAEALAAGIARSVATRELTLVGEALGWSGDCLREPVLRQNEGPGNALMATLRYAHHAEVFTQFGEKNLSAEQVARRLVSEVRHFERSTAAVGSHLADQLALPLALAGSGSYTASEITLHASTNFEVIERFLPVKFERVPADRGTRVSVRRL